MDRARPRHALSDRQWSLIRDSLPASGGTGRPWKEFCGPLIDVELFVAELLHRWTSHENERDNGLPTGWSARARKAR